MLTIRPAQPADFEQIWPFFAAVVRAGDTLAYDPKTTKEEGLTLWFAPDKSIFIALEDDNAIGTYYLKANQPGLGDHVANAGYIVDPAQRGKGVARALCAHSLETAKAMGFTAMQFNLVIATNAPAVHLWQSMGFQTLGTIPGAFRHATLGLVDALIMHRKL